MGRQEGSVGSRLALDAWNGLSPFDRSAKSILAFLRSEGFVDVDVELLGIGPAAEARYGRRHSMGMTAVFTAPRPARWTQLACQVDRLDPAALLRRVGRDHQADTLAFGRRERYELRARTLGEPLTWSR